MLCHFVRDLNLHLFLKIIGLCNLGSHCHKCYQFFCTPNFVNHHRTPCHSLARQESTFYCPQFHSLSTDLHLVVVSPQEHHLSVSFILNPKGYTQVTCKPLNGTRHFLRPLASKPCSSGVGRSRASYTDHTRPFLERE